MRTLDLLILVAYLVGVTAFGCSFYFRKGVGGTKWGTGDIAFDMRPNQKPAVFENNLVGVITNDVLPTTASACLPLGTDPQFVTNGPAYRIERTSPCRDAGRNLEWFRRRRMATDFEGQARPRLHAHRPLAGAQKQTGGIYGSPQCMGSSV